MNRGYRLVIVSLIAAPLVTAEFGFTRPAPGADDAPKKEQPAKKTTAELLIGTWRLEEKFLDGRVMEKYPTKSLNHTLEFAADGKLTDREYTRVGTTSLRTGKYRLDGQVVHLVLEAMADKKAREWSMTIGSITDDRMTTESDGGRVKWVYSRGTPYKEDKTFALLLGRWRLVKEDGRDRPLGGPTTLVRFDEGEWFATWEEGGPFRFPRMGTFDLKGTALHLSTRAVPATGAVPAVEAKEWDLKVESVTEDKLVTVTADGKTRTEYARVAGPKEEPPALAPPLVAQPPGPGTAELLVGTWLMTESDGHPMPFWYVTALMVFAKDGTLMIRAIDPRRNHPLRTGTYRLEGNTLHLSTDATATDEARKWSLVIEVITKEEMITVSARAKEKSRFKRITETPEKK